MKHTSPSVYSPAGMGTPPQHHAFHVLGSVVARNEWNDADALFRDAAEGGVDARWFLDHMALLRVGRNSQLQVQLLLDTYDDLTTSDAPLHRSRYVQLNRAMHSMHNAYITLRHIARPKGRLQLGVDAMLFGKRERRRLSHTGLVRGSLERLESRADAALLDVWNSIESRPVVVWVDNFYKRRYGVNPTNVDTSLNATALAVLENTPPIGPFSGYPSIDELVRKIGFVTAQLTDADTNLIEFVRSSFAGVQADAVRVPLDVKRGKVTGQRWRPLSLERTAVGSDVGLLHTIEELRMVARHTRCVTPVLVDENIHYRMMKWVYCATYNDVEVRRGLQPLVFLYGVWHPYKFLCLHLHRIFFDTFVYINHAYTPCVHARIVLIDTRVSVTFVTESVI